MGIKSYSISIRKVKDFSVLLVFVEDTIIRKEGGKFFPMDCSKRGRIEDNFFTITINF
jgi:hypothetical protein